MSPDRLHRALAMVTDSRRLAKGRRCAARELDSFAADLKKRVTLGPDGTIGTLCPVGGALIVVHVCPRRIGEGAEGGPALEIRGDQDRIDFARYAV